jgi:uncharacterized membrane protein
MTRVWRALFWLVVGASLLMNAVVLGLFLRHGELRKSFSGGDAGLASLPQDVQADLRAALRDHRQELQGPLAELREARRAMFDAAAVRPIDRPQAEAAMERVREASTALQLAAQMIMLNALASKEEVDG